MSLFGGYQGLCEPNTQSNTRILPNTQKMQDARKQFDADPVGILRGCGMNIPDGMSDPREIAMHLFRSGQIGRNGLMIRR